MNELRDHRPQSSLIFLIIFLVVNTVVLGLQPLLPFIDLPNHLAEATIYKYSGETGNSFSRYYQTVPWYFPNTFHTVFCSLFPDVEVGNKVFHVLYMILLHGSVFLVIRELKGNLWYGLLALLFTYNYNVTYGFTGFIISIPVLILLFYVTVVDLRMENPGLKLLIAVLLVLLFLMHAQNALLGLLIYGVLTLYRHWRSFGKLLVRAVLVPLPLLVLIFTWWFTRPLSDEEPTGGYLLDYYTRDYVGTFFMRLRLPVFDHFQLYDGLPGVGVAGFFFACVIAPVLWYRPWRHTSFRRFASSDHARYALVFFITVLGCYVFLPDKLPGQTPLFQRFCTMVMLTFIMVGALWLGPGKYQGLKYFVGTIAILYSLVWFEYMYSFNKQNRNFSPGLFSGISNQSTLAGLIYDNDFRGRKVYIHYPNYFVVWNRGIAASKIIDYRFGVVRRVGSPGALPFYHELIGEVYRPQPQYADLDLLLVRGEAPVSPDPNLIPFDVVKVSGEWKLYKNTRKARPAAFAP